MVNRNDVFSRFKAFRIVILIGAMIGCGPTVKLNSTSGEKRLESVVILPATPSDTVREDRVEYIRNRLASELRNNGFNVLDEKAVASACGATGCDRQLLSSKYLVDGFVDLSVESADRNNFLAGYFNVISGSVRLSDAEGLELVSVKHTERETGGLLFESGQIIQGIISQARNAGEESFATLADKFVRTVVSKLPQSAQNSSIKPEASDAQAVFIKDVVLKGIQRDVYEICVNGTPSSMGSLLIASRKTNLREANPGRYCGIYRFSEDGPELATLQVELRSPFGNAVRQDVKPASLDGGSFESAVMRARPKTNLIQSM